MIGRIPIVRIISKQGRFICRHLFLAFLFLAPVFSALSAFAADAGPVKIGVLALRGSEKVSQRWVPTAEYLNTVIPGHSFEIVPLDFTQVREAVRDQTIDFLITNSGYYIELEYEFGVTRIATMKNLLNHIPKTLFGGVIFTRSTRNDINNLTDLKGKSFSAVDQESLGGWLMALREFRAKGITPDRDFKALNFAGTHDAVVLAVLNGDVDAGTVRTDTLEKMAAEGKIGLDSLKILNPQKDNENFRYLHSTRLYPEWPFAKLKHTSEKLSEKVAIALMSMPAQSQAAKSPHIGGWTVPLDYTPVHELLRELEIGPYRYHFGKISFSEIVEQHWHELLILLLLFTVLLFVTSYTVWLNGKLTSAKVELATQLETLRRAQNALQESERNYREIFHSTNDAFLVLDLASGAILDVNQTMYEMYGYFHDEVQHLFIKDLSADESSYTGEDANRWITKTLAEGPQTFEWRARRKTGEVFWVEIHLKPANINGQERLLAVVHDIEARKKAEDELSQYRQNLEKMVKERTAELKKSESSLAEAQRLAHLGNWEWLIPTDQIWWSDEAYRIYGYEPGKISPTYKSCLAVVHPADRDLVERAIEDALQKRSPYNIEHRLLLADGTERQVHQHGDTFYDANGKPVRMVGIIQDTTERMLLEQERTRLVKAVEYAAETIVVTDRTGTIQYVNPAFTKVTGYEQKEALGKNMRILRSGRQDRSFYKKMWNSLSNGESWSGHFINLKKDGTFFEEDATISPIMDGGGNIINYVAVKHDVSEKIELEKQLRQAQKLECIGTLAGGVAHDFNNILTAILGYATIVLDKLPENSPLRERQYQVIKAGQRAADLVKQILTFSHRGEQNLMPLQPHLVIKEALKLLRATIPTTIKFKLNIEKNCGKILADPTQIHQVVMNLCTNAYHAMRNQGEGVLGVALNPVELEAVALQNKIDLQPGPYIRLEVSDTGHGMATSVQEKIFEPYFTTKERGEGTGLGLSLVHGIIKSMGGGITVYSKVGTGTTFHIYLPQVTSDANRETQPESTLIGGHERLLIVDDEVIIVHLEQEILESLGYHVTATSTSMEAWQIFKKQPKDFDLIMTDMNMPYMNGMELTGKIKEIREDIPVILCTGYSEIINDEKVRKQGINEYLMKPITTNNLATAIRRALR